MQFLDSAKQPRKTSSNVRRNSIESNSPPRSPDLTNTQGIADPMDEQSPSSPRSVIIKREILFSPEIPSSPETPAPKLPTKRELDSEGEMYQVLNYLKNNKKHDAVDYLFISYAETFKKLKPKTQAEVKLKLAHIFTEAELKDLEEN